MSSSRSANTVSRFAGADIGVPEVQMFGYFKFREAVHIDGSWAAFAGPQVKFVLEGEVNWEEEGDGVAHVLGRHAVIFPAGRRHRVVNAVYPPSEQLWIIMRDPAEVAEPGLLTGGAHELLCQLLNSTLRLRDIEGDCWREILGISRLLLEPAVPPDASLFTSILRARLHSVLVEFWRTCMAPGPLTESSRLASAVKSFFEDNWSDDICIADVAARFGCSRGHLHAVFRKEIGMPPNDYLQVLRIRRSCESLQSSDDTITDIAFDNGFGSAQYFSKVFRKYVGLTPSEYRLKPSEAALYFPRPEPVSLGHLAD